MVVAGRLVLAGECRVRVCFVVCVRVSCPVSCVVRASGRFFCLFVCLRQPFITHVACHTTEYIHQTPVAAPAAGRYEGYTR